VIKDAGRGLGGYSPMRRGYMIRRLLLASDLLALGCAFGLMVLVTSVAGRAAVGPLLTGVFIALVPVWVTLASLVGLYHLSERRVDQSFADEIGPVAMVTTVWSWLLLICASALTAAPIELLGPMAAWLGAILAVLALRGVARRIARNSAWFRQPVLLIGSAEDIDRVLSRVIRHPELGLDPIASICMWEDSYEVRPLGPLRSLRSDDLGGRVPGRPRPDEVQDLIIQVGIGRVIVTGWSESVSERTEFMRILSECGVCIDYVSGEPEALYSTAVLHHIEGLPILTIRPTATRVTRSLKRAIDVIASAAGLAILSPLLAFVALRIRLGSPGPIVFHQPRAGIDGVQFQLLKFRTMVDGADEMRDALRANDDRVAAMKMLKLREDPRVTPFGARLRRWSIDELPQLWNVLRGDMSLVGPRPLPLDELRFIDDHFTQRLRMRPGITGPWQIHGRSDIPFDDMVKLDYMYVAGWTMREDLRLLARTLGAVLHGRGAY
jgi:exopolysaccharide biosynthesis polyprenyl glycosylphosphotransferase